MHPLPIRATRRRASNCPLPDSRAHLGEEELEGKGGRRKRKRERERSVRKVNRGCPHVRCTRATSPPRATAFCTHIVPVYNLCHFPWPGHTHALSPIVGRWLTLAAHLPRAARSRSEQRAQMLTRARAQPPQHHLLRWWKQPSVLGLCVRTYKFVRVCIRIGRSLIKLIIILRTYRITE